MTLQHSEETGTSVVACGAPACLKTARLNERDDDYPRVVCQLNHRWRVIDCRDRLQWVLQRRAGHLNGRPRWDGNAYCRSRAGLLANIEERAGDADPAALAVIKALPDRQPRPTDVRWLCRRDHKAEHRHVRLYHVTM